MTQGKTSVVITTFNRPHLVSTAIESVLNQTYPAHEVIVVDEGESTPTKQVVERFPGVRYFWKQDDGLSGARNAGLKLATGDYINFLDDDDWILPRKLEVQCKILDQNPHIDVVYCRLYRALPDRTVVGEYLRNHRIPSNFLQALLQENFILAHAPLIRRQTLLGIGGFDADSSSSEEYDGWIRLALSGARFHFCDEVLAVVRAVEGSMSSNLPRLLRKIETGYLKNREALRPYRDQGGREWWLASPAYRLGRLALEQGDIQGARRELCRALNHNPWHWSARLYLVLAGLPAPICRFILRFRGLKRRLLGVLNRTLARESRWGV